GIVQPEELVRVAREAVAAGHLTAAIRIHGPAEWHRPAVELVQEVLGAKLVIFDAAPLVDREPEPLRHPGCGNTGLDSVAGSLHRHVLSVPGRRITRGPTAGSPGS